MSAAAARDDVALEPGDFCHYDDGYHRRYLCGLEHDGSDLECGEYDDGPDFEHVLVCTTCRKPTCPRCTAKAVSR